jgi:two-component system OmpR family response regulator
MKIVIIEDSNSLRENLHELFALKGYNVLSLPTGHEAIDKLINFSPDIILCDILLPGKDGYQILAEVRKNDELKKAVFIFITAKSDSVQIREGMNLGADDYLTKPFSFDDLMAAIKTRVDRHSVLNNTENNQILGEKLKNLTRKEREIIKLIGRSYSSVEISKELFISKKTVDNHRNNIIKKLNFRGKLSLVKFALGNSRELSEIS